MQGAQGDKRRSDWGDGLHEEHVGHRRMVQGDDERARGDRRQRRDCELGSAHRGEGPDDPVAFRKGNEGEERQCGDKRAAGDLRRRTDRQLALEHAGARPGKRGERDEDLPASAAAELAHGGD